MRRAMPWCLAILFAAPSARAQSACADAQSRLDRARPLMFGTAPDFPLAARILREAFALCPSDRLLEAHYGLALSQSDAPLDAEVHLQRVLVAMSSQNLGLTERERSWVVERRAALEESLRLVQGRLGSLRVVVRDGVQATLEIDNGSRVALPSADPVRVLAGDVTFTVRAPGHVPVTRVVHVEHDDVTVQEITLDAEPPPAPVAAPAPVVLRVPEVLHRTVRPSPMRTAGWITAGVGAASLVAGVGVWIATALDADRVRGATLSSADPDLRAWANVSYAMGGAGDPCTSTAGSVEDRNTVRQLCAQNDTMRAFAYGLGIAGLAATATGLVLALTSHDRIEERRERLTVSVAATPTSAGASVAVPF